jgi:CubicO group peptidase (beta-lactamase class C family)
MTAACLLAFALAYFPPSDSAGGWRTRLSGAFDPVFDYVQGTTKHGGLLVVHKGWLVYERYFGMGHRDATPNLASCGKSFTSVAVGILVHERPDLFPDGLDQRIYSPRYLPPEAFPLDDPAKADIRLGHLLAMTSGLRGNTPGFVRGKPVAIDPPGPDGWPAIVDANAFRVSMWCKAGEGYSYATAGIHLASVILRYVTGMELEQFLAERVGKPLGWGRWGFGYRRPEVTHTPGGGGIALRATDMLRFGYLLLQRGQWNGRQVIPADYVRHCSRRSPYNRHSPYSLQFDVNEDGHLAGVPRDAFWKMGSGGHCFYVVPSLDLVVWKLGGRDEQYGQVPGDVVRYDGSRERWKPSEPDAQKAAHLTIQKTVAALKAR